MFEVIRKIWHTGIVTKKLHFEEETSCYYGVNTNSDLEKELGVKLQRRVREVLGNSLHIRHVDSGSCNACDFEMSTLNNPIYDIQRFGIDFVASPRHADMLMVTGGVTRHLEEALRKTFNATAKPKLVVAVGDCACGKGIVGENYAGNCGVDKIVPVFIYVPGCPPTPQALIEGILTAIDQYEVILAGGDGGSV